MGRISVTSIYIPLAAWLKWVCCAAASFVSSWRDGGRAISSRWQPCSSLLPRPTGSTGGRGSKSGSLEVPPSMQVGTRAVVAVDAVVHPNPTPNPIGEPAYKATGNTLTSRLQSPCQPQLPSQRSLHYAKFGRLLLKVVVHGTHQCDFSFIYRPQPGSYGFVARPRPLPSPELATSAPQMSQALGGETALHPGLLG